MKQNFYNDIKIVAGQTSPEDALSAADYPASGSYIDVSGFEWVNVVVHLGAVHASDTPTFELKQSDAANGTADTIDTTNAKFTMTGSDDDEFLHFFLETQKLNADHHFLTCAVSGVSNGSYGDIVYFLGGARHLPVTQTSSLPATNTVRFAG